MSDVSISGTCDPAFAAVREVFERNFAERGEVGASVSVIHEGRTVVDLWGGIADHQTGRAWERDTKCVVWSTTKGLTAMCALVLAERGELDLFAPVTRYWPEYGQNGKEKTLVAHFLCHQAGMCVVTEPIPYKGIFDWERMIRMIEREPPQFEPGTRVGYSALIYGWLVGELVRRVSGKSLGEFLRDEIARPLGADCWIGLPPELEGETAKMIGPTESHLDLSLPGYETARVLFTNSGGYIDFTPGRDGRALYDTPEGHAAEIGGGGAVANGRGLARIYAPWAHGGEFDGVRLVGPDTIALAGAAASAVSHDFTMRYAVRFSIGFQKSWDNRRSKGADDATMLLSETAFGYCGYGGSVAFADPAEKLSYGYAMNQMSRGSMDARSQGLIDAVYRTIGYRSNAAGRWCR